MKGVVVAPGLTLPLEVVVEKTAILAKSGAGKSNTAKVIVEGVLDYGAQVVIFDPVGHWWGLRSLFPIPVLGGMNGDIPLDPLAGKLIADVIVESGQSMVLDVSLMDSDGEMQRFAYEVAERLYKLKQLHPTAVLVVLEEADEFAPQDTRGANVARMVGAWNRIAKRGRGRGIGLLSVTLRSAALSKNVLNQSDRIIAMRTTAPLDLGAIEDWVKYHRAEGADAVIPSLPGLATGEAWVWHPEEGVLVRVKITKARSLDTSATPKVGAKPAARKRLKPIDLRALGAKIADLADKAKADDPEELRKLVKERDARVAALERANREQAARLEAATDGKEAEKMRAEIARLERELAEAAGRPVISDKQVKDIERIVARAEAAAAKSGDAWEHVRGVLVPLAASVQGALGARSSAAAAARPPAPVPARRDPPRPAPVPALAEPEREYDGDVKLKAGARRILEALASHHPMRLTRSQIATIAKLKKTGGTFGSYWSSVNVAGFIEESDGTTAITQAGLDYIGIAPREPQTPEELLAMWHGRLKKGAREMIDLLVSLDGQWVEREWLAEQVGMAEKGGTFGSYVSTLKQAGLADVDGRRIRASETLFLGAVAA